MAIDLNRHGGSVNRLYLFVAAVYDRRIIRPTLIERRYSSAITAAAFNEILQIKSCAVIQLWRHLAASRDPY